MGHSKGMRTEFLCMPPLTVTGDFTGNSFAWNLMGLSEEKLPTENQWVVPFEGPVKTSLLFRIWLAFGMIPSWVKAGKLTTLGSPSGISMNLATAFSWSSVVFVISGWAHVSAAADSGLVSVAVLNLHDGACKTDERSSVAFQGCCCDRYLCLCSIVPESQSAQTSQIPCGAEDLRAGLQQQERNPPVAQHQLSELLQLCPWSQKPSFVSWPWFCYWYFRPPKCRTWQECQHLRTWREDQPAYAVLNSCASS